MGKTTIEWTSTYHEDGTVTPGYTFNPWWGCQKVSPGCASCYALTLSKRFGHGDIWGPPKTTARREMSANYWKQPIKWNDAARKAGQRARVFCASMADVFEDHPQVKPWRDWLWGLICNTAWLDWLLLTKRPENMTRMAPASWGNGWPKNIIAMTSVEDQRRADERIPHLLRVPAQLRGLSCEPLLGPVNLWAWIEQEYQAIGDGPNVVGAELVSRLPGIHWVIVGGESGHGARGMHPDWARLLRNQCQDTNTPYFFKQWGEYIALDQTGAAGVKVSATGAMNANTIGGGFLRLGKARAGRLLDGVEHNAYPE